MIKVMNTELHAEWIKYMKAYRLYDPKDPGKTVTYESTADDAERYAIENGYSGIVICDADTM